MRLFRSVTRDHQVLLPAGKGLEAWEIDSLRRRFPHLTVQIGDPVIDALTEFQDDSHDQTVAVTVNRQMGHLLTNVRTKMDAQIALSCSDMIGVQAAVQSVMQYIIDNPVAAAMLVRTSDWSDYLREHSGNVLYLSLLVGHAIRDYVQRERQRTTKAGSLTYEYAIDLTPLAVGCLFHDIGMFPIEHVITKQDPLSQEERDALHHHPIAGAELMPQDFDAVVKMVIRTHHENCDGTGYPQALPAEKLHVFSRIIRVADAYDAATSGRVYRAAKSPARVLWEMAVGPYHACYDPNVVKILVGLIQPFPIGAKVRIHDGRYAVVVRHNRKMPFRPRVIVAFDDAGKRLKKSQIEPPIDLAKHDEVRLLSFAGDDLGFLNEATPGEDWTRPPECVDRTSFAYAYP